MTDQVGSSAGQSPERPLKRSRRNLDVGNNIGRRKSACQTCRLKKIKCDLKRPECSFCKTAGSECEYITDPPKLTLESLAETINGRFDLVTKQLDELRAMVDGNLTTGTTGTTAEPARKDKNKTFFVQQPDSQSATIQSDTPETSRDFSHIPPHRTTADTILGWPIFGDKYRHNYLIETLLTSPSADEPLLQDDEDESYTSLPSVHPPEEDMIPVLVDNFLSNVHTKNPILDVETLVKKSRYVAVKGLGWDSWSCLILVACALGCIAKPFGAWEALSEEESYLTNLTTQRDLQQGESYFVLACRRLGLLKQTILAAQCHFFAGVYLMYTLRPMLSWQHFHQASITYQIYLKTNARLTENLSILDYSAYQPTDTRQRKQSRLEQRLYWSCFKSEIEFRVELPVPQSEIADFEFPRLFPSPPSPPSAGVTSPLDGSATTISGSFTSPLKSSSEKSRDVLKDDENDSIRLHAKQLCREEESWYYYLTEVALRRIGNRIINTFFTSPKMSWLNIEPYLDIAVEFEVQASSWYANLPPHMQHWEANSVIRLPLRESLDGLRVNPVSRELSWATENRLLEMRSWLYQPFLYYLVHAKPPRRQANFSSDQGSSAGPDAAAGAAAGSHHLSAEASNVLWNLIMAGIECNMAILDTRSLPHRHHGLWYDLRAIMAASLILLAIIKSGYADLIPGGVASLLGTQGPYRMVLPSSSSSSSLNPPNSGRIEGKLNKVLAQFRLWLVESPEMRHHAEVLENSMSEVWTMNY